MKSILLLGGVVLLIFFFTAHIFHKIKIPILLGYILLGFFFSDILTETISDFIYYSAQIGIVFLFFLVGLRFPLNYLLNLSRRIWQAGFLDIFLNFGVTFFIAYTFGFTTIKSLIVAGVAYTTSSSITKKMLEESNRTSAPEADFKLALLLFEDISAPIIISLLTAFSVGEKITLLSFAIIFIKIIFTIVIAILITIYVFRNLELFFKRYLEVEHLVLFLISIAFLTSGIAAFFGLSKLLGAFLAGVMLSETQIGEELLDKILPVKNLLLPLFFFWFGTTISIQSESDLKLTVFLLTLIIWSIIGKLLVGWFGGRFYGLSKKSSIRASFSIVQRGEFSLIIASLAETTDFISFNGLYIIITAIIGVMLFHKAPIISKKIFASFY